MTPTNNVHSKLKDAHFGDWKLAEILQSPNHFSQNGPFSPVIMEPPWWTKIIIQEVPVHVKWVCMASSHTDFSLSMLTDTPWGSNWRALAVHHKLTDITGIIAC